MPKAVVRPDWGHLILLRGSLQFLVPGNKIRQRVAGIAAVFAGVPLNLVQQAPERPQRVIWVSRRAMVDSEPSKKIQNPSPWRGR